MDILKQHLEDLQGRKVEVEKSLGLAKTETDKYVFQVKLNQIEDIISKITKTIRMR